MGTDRRNRVRVARRRDGGPGRGREASSTAAGRFEYSRGEDGDRFKVDETHGVRRAAAGPPHLRGVRRRMALARRRVRRQVQLDAEVRRLLHAREPDLGQHDGARRRRRERGREGQGANTTATSSSTAARSSRRRCSTRGLVDELRLMVFPVVLGSGKRHLRRDGRQEAPAPHRLADGRRRRRHPRLRAGLAEHRRQRARRARRRAPPARLRAPASTWRGRSPSPQDRSCEMVTPTTKKARGRGPSLRRRTALRGHASTSAPVLCTTTSPPVIIGAFGIADSSFSSRTQSDATRVDSSACADRLEEADGAHDAVAGIDEVIAAEARQFAQARREALVDLLDEICDAALVDRLVASDGGIHVMVPTVSFSVENSIEASWCVRARR